MLVEVLRIAAWTA